MSLKYEPASLPKHIYVRWSFFAALALDGIRGYLHGRADYRGADAGVRRPLITLGRVQGEGCRVQGEGYRM